MINKSNYEIYFIDYFDGNLDAQQVAELFLFLEKHPGLKTEFESFDNVKLDAPVISFSAKESLKKNIVTAENFNEYAVGNLEDNLSRQEKKMYDNFVASDVTFKKEHELFGKTKLQPDLKIVLPNKNSLKREQKIFRLTPLYYAAAACIVLLMGFYFFSSFDKQEKQVANSQPEIKTAAPLTNEKINQANENVVKENVSNNTPEPIASNNSEIKSTNKKASTPSKRLKREIAIPVRIEIIPATTIAINEISNSAMELIPVSKNYQEEFFADVNHQDEPNLLPTKNFITVKEAAKEFAIKKLNTFASSDVNLSPQEKRQGKKVRVLDVLATVVNKITFKRVNIQTAYTSQGQLMAYSVSAGTLNFEKNLLK